jgi:hypothetical protein
MWNGDRERDGREETEINIWMHNITMYLYICDNDDNVQSSRIYNKIYIKYDCELSVYKVIELG